MTTLALLIADPWPEGHPVLAFRGREAVSRPFRFDLTVAVPEVAVPELELVLLGEPAVLALDVPGGEPRSLAGVLARIETGRALEHHQRALRLTLVPRLSRLSHRVTSRIFQDLTVPEIVAAVLEEGMVPHRSTLAAKYRRRCYCVQHRESDLAFVTRLCAEEGIWYFFEHGEHGGEDTVVLADSAHLYPPIAGDPKLVIREGAPGDARHVHERDVFRFDARRALAAGAVLHRDHDFRRPGLDRRGSAQDQHAELRVYDHGESEEEFADVGPSSAGLRLGQLRRRAVSSRGWTACRRLTPGLRFDLADLERMEREGSYAITRVTHEGRAAEPGGEPRYEARFGCVPAQLGLRPKRPRRVLQQVTETARVVGPQGQEIYADELGRVKVQFRWDLDGQPNEQSSCWLRVATPWAGPGFGTHFVPRVGMEVLVTFLDGDVDHPVVVGCLYNGAHRPPFVGPTKNGLVTRSSPRGTAGSELSFEDAAGREQVTLHAQRDLVESAVRDREESIGRDHRVSVKGSAREDVRADKVVDVGGTLRENVGSRSARVLRDTAEHILGGSNRVIAQRDLLTVHGDQFVHVAGSSDLLVGSPERESRHTIDVLGDQVVAASGRIFLRAGERLTLACGESRIVLTPDGITLTGKRVDVAGAERVELRGPGPVLTLADDAQLVAKKVGLFAELAKLVLDVEAKLDGQLVKLNCSDEPTRSADGSPPPETQPFKLKLSDAEYGVWAGKRYQLHVDGLTLEGTTDAEGLVDKRIPKAATSAALVVWLGEYPTGPTRTRMIRLGPLAAVTSPRGAAERLAHLGYYQGEPKNTLEEELRAALRDFQEHVGLHVSGELDAATVTRLDALHGA